MIQGPRCFRAAALLCILHLTGCATTAVVTAEDPEVRAAAIALKKALDPATDPATATITAQEFAHAGYRLVDQKCTRYFDGLIKSKNGVQMAKADLIAVGSAAAVIETLTNTSEKIIGITAAGFGLATVILDNVQQYALLTPYPEQTKELVFKALDKYRESAAPGDAVDAVDAADRISGYAQLCTYSEIARLARQAIATGKPIDESTPAPLFAEEEKRAYLQPIAAMLATTPTEEELAILAYMHQQTDPDLLAKAAGKLRSEIADKVFDAATKAKKDLMNKVGAILDLVQQRNSAFAARVAAIQDQTNVTNASLLAVGAPKTVVVPHFPPTKSVRPRITVR